MNDSASAGVYSETYVHRGYSLLVEAKPSERGNWSSVITVSRDNDKIDLGTVAEVGPFWSTQQEAVRAGIERAVYLLDTRDGLGSLNNPALG